MNVDAVISPFNLPSQHGVLGLGRSYLARLCSKPPHCLLAQPSLLLTAI
jgi:hypothetical protein